MVAETMLSYAWIIPVLPLLAFAVIISLNRRAPGQGAYVAIAALAAGWLLAARILLLKIAGQADFSTTTTWVVLGSHKLHVGFAVDNLSAFMLFVVTSVALLVIIYSIGYMHGDKRYSRFFAYLSLFSAAMLSLCIANNWLLFYGSWELVGLCSYLLIGFWFEKPSAAKAAKKAFLVTRFGDAGMLIGLLMLFFKTGSFLFDTQFAEAHQLAANNPVFLYVACLFLFMGAVGKSAQFPLHVWLPDAMEGPTPVSALIHAATMVAAGVYLVARMYPLFEVSGALVAVMWIGTFTAFFAATIAIVLHDIKRVLAFSTISQLGYMMMGLGVGGFAAGMFHLGTHAFFKSLLFLGSGSVIHAMDTNDMRLMGGLGKKMPITAATFAAGALALAGFPLTAGFFSKDEILGSAYGTGHLLVFWLGAIAAFCTAFYMARLWLGVFTGTPRDEHRFEHAHESPKTMTVPLMILAFFALFAGWLGTPWLGGNLFEKFLSGGHHAEEAAIAATGSYVPMVISIILALSGLLVGALMYYEPWKCIEPARVKAALKPVYALLVNMWYFEAAYQLMVAGLVRLAIALWMFDKWIIDGLVNLVGWLTLLFTRVSAWFDKWIIDGLVNLVGLVTGWTGRQLRWVQNGQVQTYLLLVLVGVVALVVFSLANL